MGQLILGKPAPKQLFAVSAPLALTSAISMTFRADDGDGTQSSGSAFDRWLVDARRSLDAGLRHDLDLLLGFSGRLLYYVEELLFRFEALEPDRLDATFEQYIDFLSGLPAAAFQEMAANSIVRVYRDRGLTEPPPETDDPGEWRMFLRPGITRAHIDEAASVITSPEQLKGRTLALLDGFWRQCYAGEWDRHLPEMQRAARFAQAMAHPVVQVSFSELTGNRLPQEIESRLADVDRVVYSPSPHLGSFVQYILYPPTLILYFNPDVILRNRPSGLRPPPTEEPGLRREDVIEGLRALSDPSRMKIIEMLREGELYAQEIVARLGISQSAVSRHLGTLEDASVITVRPANGMKYYAIDRARLRALAGQLEAIADIGNHDETR